MKKQLIRLIERLMACEARKIDMELGIFKDRIKFNLNLTQEDFDEYKKTIYQIFLEKDIPYNPRIVRKYALEYLDMQVKIATANKSFGKLREKILDGKYDFDFSRD